MQSACFSNYFIDPTKVGFAIKSTPIFGHGGATISATFYRPFIPLVGVTNVGQTIPEMYVPVDIQSNKDFKDTFPLLAKSCYDASVNNIVGGGSERIAPGTYDQYLYKRLNGRPDEIQRFYDQIAVVYNFWNAIDGILTDSQYNEELSTLVTRIVNETDRRLFLPPGSYQFDIIVGGFAEAWEAWKNANPDLIAIRSIELLNDF